MWVPEAKMLKLHFKYINESIYLHPFGRFNPFGRFTKLVQMEENGIQLTRDKKTMDDEEREIVFSNLEEVNHHESYYLHLPSDSAYGHKTRQIFREEAASQHGFDSIYFYAKQLIEKHGVTTKKNKIPIELTETNFKTLIAAMPSLDAYLSEEQIVALFYQIDTRHKKAINLIDLVSFCLLDKQQM